MHSVWKTCPQNYLGRMRSFIFSCLEISQVIFFSTSEFPLIAFPYAPLAANLSVSENKNNIAAIAKVSWCNAVCDCNPFSHIFIHQYQKQEFLEWKAAKREELTKYQKQIEEQYVANVEKEMERWQNARKARKANNDMLNLQETMDKELDTHRLEHGPKPRKIPGGSNNEDEDDVEDINVGEDDMSTLR